MEDKNNGIYVDNLSLRGYSGTTLNKISKETLKILNDYLNFKLIIFQYGPNIYNEQIKDYSFYYKQMVNVINHFKAALPKTDFLIISMGDKSILIDEEYTTDYNIINLINAQEKVAVETSSSFINLFRLMGGFNSMVSWVEKKLAAKDYTHFSRIGGRIIAKKIFESISNYLSGEKKELNYISK